MKSIEKLTDTELYSLCQDYGLKACTWKRKFAGLLSEVYKRKLFRKKGFISIYEFAQKIGGMSEFATTKVLNISRRLEDKPILLGQLESGRQGWSKIEKVAYIATPETDSEWAEKVSKMSTRSLESYVKECRKNGEITHVSESEEREMIRQDLTRLSFAVTEKIDHQLRVFKRDLEKKRREPLSWNEVFEELLKMKTVETNNIELKVCPKCAEDKGATARSRSIPEIVKKVVIAKYQNKCGFPGCNRPWVQFHHTLRYSITTGHVPNAIVPLCKTHHDLMHSGLIGNEDMPPERWYIKNKPNKNSLSYLIDQKVQNHRIAKLSLEESSRSP